MPAPLACTVPPTVGLRSPAQPLMQIASFNRGVTGAAGPAPAGAIAPPAPSATPTEPPRSNANAAAVARAIRLWRRQALRSFANCPLFLRPAELAVGLALKELRYGPIRPTRPGDLPRPKTFPPPPAGDAGGDSAMWRGSIEPAPVDPGTPGSGGRGLRWRSRATIIRWPR